jgi:hypothetical protein
MQGKNRNNGADKEWELRQQCIESAIVYCAHTNQGMRRGREVIQQALSIVAIVSRIHFRAACFEKLPYQLQVGYFLRNDENPFAGEGPFLRE